MGTLLPSPERKIFKRKNEQQQAGSSVSSVQQADDQGRPLKN
jgi:hypothetical protein